MYVPKWLEGCIKQEKLLDRFWKNPEVGGYVVLNGGQETISDTASLMMGFCLQCN